MDNQQQLTDALASLSLAPTSRPTTEDTRQLFRLIYSFLGITSAEEMAEVREYDALSTMCNI